MKKNIIAKSILASFLLSAFATYGAQEKSLPMPGPADNSPPPVRFESPEHQSIGAAVLLKTPGPFDDLNTIKGKPGNMVWVKKYDANGTKKNLTYADIVWLSGDLMAEPNESIGLSNTPIKALDANLAAFDKYQKYLPEVLEVYREMVAELDAQMTSGQKLDLSNKYDYKFNSATGGWGGIASLLNWGLYLELANSNYDHFGKQAVKTYLTAHEKALKVAANATSFDDLRTAYFIDGFGAHFLSDLFASGHVRVPRYELTQLCVNSVIKPSVLNSLNSKAMHDADGEKGLILVNGRGESWFAKGDKNYYTLENIADRQRVVSTLQQSIDQVYNAFASKNPNIAANNSAMLQIMPDLEAIKTKNKDSHPPLFYVSDNGTQIYKRQEKTNSYAVECP